MQPLSVAEKLLIDLGVSMPSKIDLELIARSVGVKIKDRRLDGCEARIVGENNRAIISIDDRVSPRRRRFSIGHELGHWMCHRGQCLACQKTDIGRGSSGSKPAERAADRYAADLLMPRFMLRDVVKRRKELTLDMINDVAEIFNVSRIAASLRLIETEVEPSILIKHSKHGDPWRLTSRSVDRKWRPFMRAEIGSHAYDILHKGAEDQMERVRVAADDWFDNEDAGRFEVLEQSFRSVDGEVLTLITIVDEEMLAE